MWNYAMCLEKQGPKVWDAKDCRDTALEEARLAKAVASGAARSAPGNKFLNNVLLTPSKKRAWSGHLKMQISPDQPQDIGSDSPPPSPTEEMLQRR
ncbi:hypothetical protein DFQ26_009302 [Actinomortierella ambigua]|nr:hypothetical protein DFQ26_009302 [Actinomortierella ambigua]